jgi:hypothetical protein
MKKILLLAGLVFGSFGVSAQSYEASLGLGALSSGQLKLEGMYHFMDNQSFNLELRGINNSLESDDGTILASAGGFALSPEYIVYFNSRGDDNEGVYLGSYLRFKTMSTQGWEEYDDVGNLVPANFSQTALGAGLNFGWHGALDNGLTYRLYVGGGYNFVNAISHTDTYESALSLIYGVPIHVRSGVNIGYRF